MTYERWLWDFQAAKKNRAEDPDWDHGAAIAPPVVKSLQRFQVGEAGDGANLIAKAEGDETYLQAVKLFVAEEQNHARLLAKLLEAAGAQTIDSHWSDTVFVRLRRALGLRLELMVLLIAEVVALRYYRAVRDGAGDRLTSDVAGRILADEERHVPFHCHRLRDGFAHHPKWIRGVVFGLWRLLQIGVTATVALDHGPALHALGIGRRAFFADVAVLFEDALRQVKGEQPLRRHVPRRARPRGLV